MNQPYSVKIDAYSHIVPPKYGEALEKLGSQPFGGGSRTSTLYDLDYRFRIMDRYEPIRQVLTLAAPAIENVADPEKSVDLAKLANDGMAELVLKYPDRFVAAIAVVPMNNIDAAIKEADRAIKELRCRGVYIHTPVNDKPLDSPEFIPLYEKMSKYNLPIFIHPMRLVDYPDYRTEEKSKYSICSTFGWDYESTVAMARLVYSGVMETYPDLKIVIHHCGAMVPYFWRRIVQEEKLRERGAGKADEGVWLTKPMIEYFRMFYTDTALYGNPSGLMCGYDFYGAEHLLFGTDFPLGCIEGGNSHYRETINAIEQMNINETDKKKIFEDNARSLMRLPV